MATPPVASLDSNSFVIFIDREPRNYDEQILTSAGLHIFKDSDGQATAD